jgi:catechol 2,3-dioxygenase-like lactoylglutathione lyase family enzyme
MAVMRPEQTLEFLAIDHIAIRVADVRRAEAFYHEFFEMDIVMRARRIGDEWEPIATDFDWHEALGAGFFPDLVYLRNGPLSLYVINAGRGAVMIEPRLAHIGLRVTPQTLTALRGIALIRAFSVVEDSPHTFRFRDPYGLTWNLTDASDASNGGTPR